MSYETRTGAHTWVKKAAGPLQPWPHHPASALIVALLASAVHG